MLSQNIIDKSEAKQVILLYREKYLDKTNQALSSIIFYSHFPFVI